MRVIADRIMAMTQGLNGDVGLVIRDLKDGNEVTHEDHMRFSAASVIKIPVLWELFRQVEHGMVSLDETVTLTGSQKVGGTGILKDLSDGLELMIKDLAMLMIIVSDNTATNIIIDRLGMERINATIASLGLKESTLQRRMMDFEAKKAGRDNFVSARDVATVMERLALGDGLRKDLCAQAVDMMLRQQLNNKLPRGLMLNPPVGARLAHKTGELSGTEHDAGILLLPDRGVVIVVLTSGLKNNEDGIRFIGDVAAEVARYYAA